MKYSFDMSQFERMVDVEGLPNDWFDVPIEEWQRNTCKHKHDGSNTCDAYPDNIPIMLAMDMVPHTSPYEGDNGIMFEPEE
jgi:hypothetical protein